jgi:hypothetical protein
MSRAELERQMTMEIEASAQNGGSDNDVFALTQKKEFTMEDLTTLIGHIRPVYEMLLLASSAVSRDVNNLPIQVCTM